MTTLLALLVVAGQAQKPFSFQGIFFEGCSCKEACPFELKGEQPGCGGAGFYAFAEGNYAGQSIADTRIAFIAGPNGWLRLYVDGRNPKNRAAATKFITAAFKGWGKPESVEHRPITLSYKDNVYTGLIDGGKTLSFRMEAQVKEGGEFVVHKNIFNRTLHPDIMQGKTLDCAFKAGKRKLNFKESNGFFHPTLKVSGKI